MTIVEQIIARRQQVGLRLAFESPGRDDVFVCYPKDQAAKVEWLAKAQAAGWKRANLETDAQAEGH